jgi:uncharacterized protein (DUF4415 family)
MNAKLKNTKSNLKKVDAQFIKKSEYDELPEITDEMFARSVYKVDGVKKTSSRKRGAQKNPKKIALNLRLPHDVVEYFKLEGRGWQTKIGVALQEWIKKHPHSSHHR